jgi:hypothetical protein
MPRREALFVADLVETVRDVNSFLEGVSRERWDGDRILQSAVLSRSQGRPRHRAMVRSRTLAQCARYDGLGWPVGNELLVARHGEGDSPVGLVDGDEVGVAQLVERDQSVSGRDG